VAEGVLIVRVMAENHGMEEAIEVPLRRRDGTIRAVALIDAADAERVLAHRWCLDGAGYATRNVQLPNGKRTMLLLHRFLLGLEHGDPREVDHENRNPLDCRRSNLRIATTALNGQNRSAAGNRGSSSRYRGVTWDKRTGRWKAIVCMGARTHNLGRFDDEAEAARVAADFRAQHMPFAAPPSHTP
jgi:hypothetical protein